MYRSASDKCRRPAKKNEPLVRLRWHRTIVHIKWIRAFCSFRSQFKPTFNWIQVSPAFVSRPTYVRVLCCPSRYKVWFIKQ
jgi:hypothetical protein